MIPKSKFYNNTTTMHFIISCCIALICITGNAQVKQAPVFKQAGYYTMKLGDFQIIALSDGTILQKLDVLLKDTTNDEIDKMMKNQFQTSQMECSVNAYLINTGNKLILVDAGTSGVFGPALGHITESLQNAGITPEQIDAVLLTHIHMDHIGGIVNGEKLTFPNAEIFISAKEADYYLNAENKEKAPQEMKRFFDDAVLKLTPVIKTGKLKKFEFGNEILPGVTPMASFGHTPGHTFFKVESQGQKIVFMGDIIVSNVVQFMKPEITSVYDYDRKQAAESRKKALNDAAQNGYWVAVSHISFPGIGHIATDKNGFRFVPINFSNSGSGQ